MPRYLPLPKANPARSKINDRTKKKREAGTTYLLEPNFEVGIQYRNERVRLLTRSLGDSKEVCTVLGSQDLLSHKQIFPKELVHEGQRIVKGGKICKMLAFAMPAKCSSTLPDQSNSS